MELSSIALIINYLAFAGLYLYRFLKPLEWGEWLINSGKQFINLLVAASVFLMAMLIPLKAAETDILGLSLPAVFFAILALLAISFMIYSKLSSVSLAPIIIFFASLFQEMYYAMTNPDPHAYGVLLISYYGSLLLSITLGFFMLAPIMDLFFSKAFNQNWVILQNLRRKNPGKTYFDPDQVLSAVLIFSAAMIVRAILSS